MNSVEQAKQTIPAMTDAQLDVVREIERINSERPQIDIQTLHEFHAGLYSRTIKIPAGVRLTGAFIVIETLLIVSGDVSVTIGGDVVRITGYGTIPASANRKQVFMTHGDTYLTMVFKTDATTIEEAEEEFTNEAHRLGTRRMK